LNAAGVPGTETLQGAVGYELAANGGIAPGIKNIDLMVLK